MQVTTEHSLFIAHITIALKRKYEARKENLKHAWQYNELQQTHIENDVQQRNSNPSKQTSRKFVSEQLLRDFRYGLFFFNTEWSNGKWCVQHSQPYIYFWATLNFVLIVCILNIWSKMQQFKCPSIKR
jgi:hypothetical protein